MVALTMRTLALQLAARTGHTLAAAEVDALAAQLEAATTATRTKWRSCLSAPSSGSTPSRRGSTASPTSSPRSPSSRWPTSISWARASQGTSQRWRSSSG
ncbi:hypothetical protein [Nannocystis pusilla]|uniref:hypothetical protein n=1 Tax=Nannocystis pusilla TaxID=889268 RepID=UPI003B7D1703